MSRVLGPERCGVEWWTGDSRLARLNYAMHSIDDLKDAVKGWLQPLEKQGGWLGRLGYGAWAPGVCDTRLGTAEISSSPGVRVLVARDGGRKAWLGRVSEAWAGSKIRLRWAPGVSSTGLGAAEM